MINTSNFELKMKSKISVLFIVLFLSFLASGLNPAGAQAAVTFSLSPSSKTINVGDSVDVSILLDTGGQTVSGGSAILTFDPSKLQVVDSNAAQVGVQVSTGSVFTTALTNSVDTVNGKITLDYGLSAGAFSGSGTFGKISFKGLIAATSTPVSFIIGSGASSTSSAVYASGSNVLGAANSGSYTVLTATASTTPTPISSASALPRTGAVENTIFLLMLGFFILSGGVVLAKVKA